jgi:3-deoxy-manno-octulosonate cytidylyltransferase (CMP-KDO synthetase)
LRVIGIPARLRSTRLPEKMLREIEGKPVIRWTVENALKVEDAKVIVATDDERIKDAVEDICEVRLTPSDLPSGTDRLAYALRDLDDGDLVINLQGDEPFVDPDILKRLFFLMESESADIYTLAREEDRNEDPNRVKVVLDSRNFALYFSRLPIPYRSEKVLIHIGIYGYRKKKLLEFSNLPRPRIEELEVLEQLRALYHGWKIRVEVVDYRGISIDTEQDLERAKGIYLKGN